MVEDKIAELQDTIETLEALRATATVKEFSPIDSLLAAAIDEAEIALEALQTEASNARHREREELLRQCRQEEM